MCSFCVPVHLTIYVGPSPASESFPACVDPSLSVSLPQVSLWTLPPTGVQGVFLSGLFHVGHSEGSAGEGECGHAVSYRHRRAGTFIHGVPLPISPTRVPCLPFLLPPSPPPHPPHSLEAVRHEAVHHRIQAAVQAAQGDCDVIGEHMPRPLPQPLPSNSDPEVNQQLPDVERREADGEDHQDGGQQSDGARPPRPALLGHQALAGGQKTGDAQGEAHHGQQGEQELQDGEVEEGREEHTGGAEPQRCGLRRARERSRWTVSNYTNDCKTCFFQCLYFTPRQEQR